MVSKNAVAYAIVVAALTNTPAFAQAIDPATINVGIANANLNALLAPLAPTPLLTQAPLLALPDLTNGMGNGLNNQGLLNGLNTGTDSIGMLNGTTGSLQSGNNNGNNNVGQNFGNGNGNLNQGILNGNGFGNSNR